MMCATVDIATNPHNQRFHDQETGRKKPGLEIFMPSSARYTLQVVSHYSIGMDTRIGGWDVSLLKSECIASESHV